MLGRYRVVAELAQGGMGVVYLALMRGPGAFNKLLVLKELKPDLFEDPSVVAMFMEEARLAACLSHPNVVQTIEAGTDGNRHFIVMEHVEGQTLHRLASRAQKLGTPVPFELQSAVLCSVLEGLAYAHAATDYEGRSLGIVHRDVSPHNVLIGYDGQVKLADFGIAKATGSLTDTRVGLLKGRVAYMAPEQAAGGNVDARADLFSVGVMLWEAATGRRFWSGIGSDVQVLRALLMGDAEAAQAREMGEVEPDLRAIIVRATAFDPSQRQASASQLLQELRAAVARRKPPAFDAQQVGRFVQGLFVEERARLQAAIAAAVEFDAPVGEFASRESSGNKVPTPGQTSPGSFFPQTLAPRTATDSRGSQPGAHGAHPFEGRWILAISVVVLLGSIATLVGLVSMRRSAATTPPAALVSAASAASRAAAPADSSQEQPGDETIHLVVRASPVRAKIIIDRSFVFENPCVATLPKDGAGHTVHIEADGYAPRDDTFEAHSDVTMVVALEPRRAVAHAVTVVSHAPASPGASPPAPPPPVLPQQMAPPPEPTPSSTQAAPAPAGVPQRRINTDNPYNR
jgi:serine/threonine-protein kinase